MAVFVKYVKTTRPMIRSAHKQHQTVALLDALAIFVY